LPNRSWLETVVDLTMTGSLADPKLGGKIEVTEGFIRIPEIPRNLHPVEGSSLLWALQDSLVAAMDSTATDSVLTARAGGDSLMIFLTPEPVGPALDPPGQTVLPDLDIEVVITDDLRIIGYGMDIKLGGSMVIGRGYDEDHIPGPSIKGEIKVREGTLKVMNRVFDVERGKIKFTESVPANPNLDLMLETQVNAYLVRILVSGKAVDPVIELTSEPDLSEEDIMAVLLFGQPMNDLDNDQRGRMQEENDPGKELQKNLAGLAMAFGTKGLQDSMSDSFGVDMVQMGSDSSGDSTLMVGKFITPDIVLKYSQSLEKSGTYFMNLEYSLNRYFKVITTYGQGEEASGGELRWSKRY
jgi:autotransporter translocation and assembly factor TamB